MNNNHQPAENDRQLIERLETDIKHLENELRLTKAEYEDTIRKYFDIHFNMEERVKERTRELEQANRQLKEEIEERLRAQREKEELAGRLRQAQKLEAIGTLAGGIAHDFNNILVAILGFTELARDSLEPDNPARSDLAQVLDAGRRARDLVHHILTFSRQHEVERRPLQVYLIIKEALKLLRASLPTNIQIRQDINTKTAVDGDPTRIHQILINLCTNASHAMEEQGGTLEVELKDMLLTEEDLANDPENAPGPYLRLTVRDTGTGMDAQVMERIFEPYFTTKEVGRGSGMGLAVVHGIVKEHGGLITVESEQGTGSAFHVFLPALDLESPEELPAVDVLPSGSERILFVDDEWTGVEIGRKIMEGLGYTVTARTSSIEALEVFRHQPDRFDLVITDLTMPNMGGLELSRAILEIRPELPIILCTGYGPQLSKEKVTATGIREFAMKPLARRELAELIRRVLDGER